MAVIAQRIIISILLLALLSLTGCGFTLRGEQQLPSGVEQIGLANSMTHLPLQRALKKQLSLYGIAYSEEVLQQDMPKSVLIRLQSDNLDRRLLSLFSTGQVAEYELLLSVRYEVTFPGQPPLLVDFDISREYQDDPDAILAKSRELDLVLSEMRTQAAERIIRLLSSQYTSVMQQAAGAQ